MAELMESHHQGEIETLRKQLADVSFKKTSDLNGMRSRCVQLETDLSIATAELSASTNENVLLRQQMAQQVLTHNTDKSAIKNSLKEFESRLDIKNKTIDSLSLENEKLRKEAVSYKYSKTQDIHVLNLKVTELDTIVTIVRTETSNSVDAIKTLFNSLSGDHETMKSLIMELESYDHSHSNPQLESLLSANNRMESSMRDIGVKLEHFHDMSDKSTELFATINRLTNENTELSVKLNKTHKKLNASILKLQNELIAKNTEIMNVNAALSETTLNLRTTEQSTALKYSQLDALYQAHQVQLQEYQKSFIAAALSVREECESLISDNTDKQKRISGLEIEVGQCLSKHQQQNCVLVGVRDELTQCKLSRNREAEQHQLELKQLKHEMLENEKMARQKVSDLTRSMSELQLALDVEQQTLRATTESLAVRDGDVAELKNQLAASQEQTSLLEGKLAESEDENQKNLQQCAEMLHALQETEDELQQAQADLETKQAQWTRELTAVQSARDTLQTQYCNLEVNFNAVIEENNQYSVRMAELLTEIETLQDRMQSSDLIQQQSEQTNTLKWKALNSTIAELQSDKSALQEQVSLLMSQLEEAQVALAALSLNQEQALAELKACERVILSKQSEVQSLERDLAQKGLEVADARMQTQTAETELAAASAKIEELNSTLNGRSIKYKSTQSKVVDLEKTLAELRKNQNRTNDEHQAEMETLRSQVSDLVQQLKSQVESHLTLQSAVQREKDSLLTEIEELKASLSKSRHSVIQLETALFELRSSSQEEQTSLMASMCALENDNKALSLQLSEQLTLVDAKQSEIEELNDQLVELGFKCDGLNGDIAKHLVMVKQWEDLHAAAEKSGLEAVTELETRLNTSENACTELRSEMLLKDTTMVEIRATLSETQSRVNQLEELEMVSKSQMEDKLALIAHLEGTLQGMQTAAQSTIDNQSQLIDSLEEKHSYFQQTLSGLSSQLQHKSEELKALVMTHKEAELVWEARYREMETDNQLLRMEVTDAGERCAVLSNQQQTLLDTQTSLEAELAALRSNEVDWKNSQSILRNDYDALETNFVALQREAVDLKAALVSAESALQSVSQQQVAMVNKLSTKLNHRNDAIKLLKAEIVRLKDGKRSDQSSLSSMLTGLQTEFDALHQQIAEFSGVGADVPDSKSVSSSVETLNSASDPAAAIGVLPTPPVISTVPSVDSKNRPSNNSVGSSGTGVKSPTRIKLMEATTDDFIIASAVEDSRLRKSLDRKLA